VIFNRERGEANVHLISFASYSSTELLILMKGIGNEGNDFYSWVPDIPVDEVGGLFSGFDGGAFPYDTQTIYSYQGSGGVKPITSIPSGTLRLAAPLGEGFVAATQDTIFYWDQTQWSTLASGTVDEISTDPEGDVLFYNEYNFEYLILQDGELVPYNVFDTTTCPFSASALMAGSKRAFVCKEKPADLSCAETFETGNYLIIEENGVLICRDTPSESNPGMLFIMW
jgi:hypothetical protein